GVAVAHVEQPRERIDAPAQPAAAEPVEHGVAYRRQDVTDCDDVRRRKRDENVAVGVRFDQVAVVDARSADGRRAVGIDRLRRQALRGQRFLVAFLGWYVVARAQTYAGLLV